ncbi:hypothetical protein [Cohnella luojiensis]|uniref:Uncharacterized protein n=1 Tax=Cohnella luojiensis TaxID=652876 RepID=A0A4Y8LUH8_9BACL|nr:hypothetical protein [Cohnella luojiensis]TFE24508.1 hypothetical protein E2980_15755 [Cohnella luojiensis]
MGKGKRINVNIKKGKATDVASRNKGLKSRLLSSKYIRNKTLRNKLLQKYAGARQEQRLSDVAITCLRTVNWNNTNQILTLARGSGAERTVLVTARNVGTQLAIAVVRLNVQSEFAGILNIVVPGVQVALLFPGESFTFSFRAGLIALSNTRPGVKAVLVVSTSTNPDGSADQNPLNSIRALARFVNVV